MKIVEYLKMFDDYDAALEQLHSHYGITNVQNEEDNRVILNYSIINSVKTDPVVCEARGLVLQYGTWDIIARSFPRFFNYGECLEHTSKFNWNNFNCLSKEDGSIILLYYYNGEWRVNTRNSFGQGEVGISGKTWEELFFTAFKCRTGILDINNTYVFELVGPHNKVVRNYPTTSLFLLTVIDNKSGIEDTSGDVDYIAQDINIARPALHHIGSIEDIITILKDHPEATFEGFVVQDNTGLRIKVKNPKYIALHHLRGNGDGLFSIKNLIPFILEEKDDESEVLIYWPEIKEIFYEYKTRIDSELDKMYTVWEQNKYIENQKEFALAIQGKTAFSSILFEARKSGRSPRSIWRESADIIIKRLFK